MEFEINKDDWASFCDSLTKRRFEWITDVEVVSLTSGDQRLSRGMILNGITVETHGSQINIVISLAGNHLEHQTHTIRNPMRIAFLAADDSHGDVAEIEEADGTKTLIRFVQPMGVLVGFTKYELTVAAQ